MTRRKINGERITKARWAVLGGLRNSDLFRVADSRGNWRYYLKRESRP